MNEVCSNRIYVVLWFILLLLVAGSAFLSSISVEMRDSDSRKRYECLCLPPSEVSDLDFCDYYDYLEKDDTEN